MGYLDNFHHQLLGTETSERKLVFLHGLMGFGLNWKRIADAFAPTHQILLFDQRGHGRSFHPTLGYSPNDYAEDLRKILDEIRWPKIDLVGHSMGGRNALEFAHRFSPRVNKLVIEDIGPTMNDYGTGFIAGLLDKVPVPFASKRDAKAYFDGPFLTEFAHVTNVKGFAQFLYANLTQESPESTVTWRFYLPGIRASMAEGRALERWNEIEALSLPTLWIRGANSHDLPAEVYAEILRRNPRIKGVEIAAAGHWVHSDQPEAFISALKDFLL